jgi:acyl-CoA thioesterase
VDSQIEPVTPAAHELYANDRASQAFGIEVVAAAGGRAVVRMVVRPDMCNGLGIAHGGVTFLLADTAMAFASHAGGGSAVSTTAEIDWLAQVPAGETLTATAERRWARGRGALWDISVANAAGELVALVRGRTRQLTAAVDGDRSA